MSEVDDFLAHHGVLGMKWGKHKANPNYSQKQSNRDKAVYGKGAARRINRTTGKGAGVQEARSIEAQRRENARTNAKVGRKIGKVAGSIGGVTIGVMATHPAVIRAGTRFALKTISRISTNGTAYKIAKGIASGATTYESLIREPAVKGLIISGSTYVGSVYGQSVGGKIPLRAKGYSH